MNEIEFRKMYVGDFQVSERERELMALAQEYHERCDSYDDHICTATNPKTGESMPADREQARLMIKNANDVLRELRGRAEMAGFTFGELCRAIQDHLK